MVVVEDAPAKRCALPVAATTREAAPRMLIVETIEAVALRLTCADALTGTILANADVAES